MLMYMIVMAVLGCFANRAALPSARSRFQFHGGMNYAAVLQLTMDCRLDLLIFLRCDTFLHHNVQCRTMTDSVQCPDMEVVDISDTRKGQQTFSQVCGAKIFRSLF